MYEIRFFTNPHKKRRKLMNILLLSVAVGGGHLKAAQAIGDAIMQRYSCSKILTIDTLRYINPIIDTLVVGGYLNAVRATPSIYGKLYELSETGDNLSDITRVVNRALSTKIESLVGEFSPSLVICTHPFPLQMVSTIKRKGKTKVPLVAVLTDYAIHSFWIHEHVDAYVVANNYLKQDMMERGVPGEIIYPYGIPVSDEFFEQKDRNLLRKELGLYDMKTVLIMGGSLGYGKIVQVFASLLKSRRDIQLVAICGYNEKLKKQLEQCSISSARPVRIIGYTGKVADYMSAADLLITKPGGITVSEALVKRIPILLLSPIPGQEEKNANFLVNIGAAARIHSGENVESVLKLILDNDLRINGMKLMQKSVAKPDACHDILKLIEKLTLGRLNYK